MHTQSSSTSNQGNFEAYIRQLPPAQLEVELGKLHAMIPTQRRNPELYYAVGVINYIKSDNQQALEYFDKALKYNKKFDPAYAKITEILIVRQKNFIAALPYYKKWIKVSNHAPQLLTRLARCQLGAGKYDEALVTIKKAKAANPKDPVVFEVLSVIYSAQGNVDATREALIRCEQLGGNPEVASRILTLPNSVPEPELIDKFVNLSKRLTAGQLKLHLYTNIASAFEARKEYEDAFQFFKAANDLGKTKLDKDCIRQSFEMIQKAFTSSFIKTKEGLGHSNDRPVFIVGMPRSGTTLLEGILAAHPEITGNGELSFFADELRSVGFNFTNRNKGISEEPDCGDRLSALPDTYFKEVAERYVTSPGYQAGNPSFQIDKFPQNFLALGLIHLVFPNAKIIHARRHPIDCALSCFKSSFSLFHTYATDLEFLGEYYQRYNDLMQWWRETLPIEIHDVYYEDVVTNTEYAARKLIDFVGVEWDDACLNHTHSQKNVRTASKWQVRQPIYTTSVAKWKNYETQLQPMIKAMGAIPEKYEAELAGLASE